MLFLKTPCPQLEAWKRGFSLSLLARPASPCEERTRTLGCSPEITVLQFLSISCSSLSGFYVLKTAAVTVSLTLEAVFAYCISVPLLEMHW